MARVRTLLHPVLFLFALSACGGGGGGSSPTEPPSSPPTGATIAFVYRAPTTLDPAVEAAEPGCVQQIGGTHLHASWLNFGATDMQAIGLDRFELTLSGVPTGVEHAIRVNDPNLCGILPNAVPISNVSANGVPLTRLGRADFQPAMFFRVAADGTITP